MPRKFRSKRLSRSKPRKRVSKQRRRSNLRKNTRRNTRKNTRRRNTRRRNTRRRNTKGGATKPMSRSEATTEADKMHEECLKGVTSIPGFSKFAKKRCNTEKDAFLAQNYQDRENWIQVSEDPRAPGPQVMSDILNADEALSREMNWTDPSH